MLHFLSIPSKCILAFKELEDFNERIFIYILLKLITFVTNNMNIPIRYRTTDFRYFTQNSEFSIITIRIQEYSTSYLFRPILPRTDK